MVNGLVQYDQAKFFGTAIICQDIWRAPVSDDIHKALFHVFMYNNEKNYLIKGDSEVINLKMSVQQKNMSSNDISRAKYNQFSIPQDVYVKVGSARE